MSSSLQICLHWVRDVITSPVTAVAATSLMGYKLCGILRSMYPTYDDEDYKRQGHVELPAPLQNLVLNAEHLAKYNAKNADGTYLLALQGVIYDVSTCREDFGPDGSLEELTGTDIIAYIKKNADADGKEFDGVLQGWKNMLDDRFYVAGQLVSDEEFEAGAYGDCMQQAEQSDEAD